MCKIFFAKGIYYPQIKNIIKSFDGDTITLDTEVQNPGQGEIKGSDEVSKMAKRALKKRS